MKINEISDKEWKIKRELLINDIKYSDIIKSFTIKRITNCNAVEISGSTLPMVFDCDNQELRVWSRCARYSGREISVNDLIKLQNIINYWYQREIAF